MAKPRDNFEYEIVAEGDQGDEQWKPKFDSLKKVQQVLCQLDAIGESNITWDALIGRHKYFEEISSMQFPPLYNLAEFADLSNDFWHVLDPPEDDDKPMQSFNWSRLYVKSKRAEIVQREFARFFDHLKTLPWIKELL